MSGSRSQDSPFRAFSISSCKDEHFRSMGHAERSLSNIQNHFKAGQFCDVVLISSNTRRIPAHRLILSAASAYFSAMFTSEMRESEQTEITLPEINDDVLQDLVNYCYTGSITIREDIIESLLTTSRLMQLDEVTEVCSQFLARQLHPSNCLGIADFAEHHNCDNLLQEATAYVDQNFMEVIRNEEFLKLSVDQMETLLTREELYVSKEQCLLQALIDWINVDSVNRKLHMARLLGFVKLPLIDMSFLANFGENVVGSDVVCLKLINQAMLWHLAPERRSEMINWNTIRPQKTTSGRLLVVGDSQAFECKIRTIQSYDPLHNTWTSAYDLRQSKNGCGIAVLGDNLLVVGGGNCTSFLKAVECLDMKTGTWSQYPAMNTPRCGLGVAVLNGSLYAVGGKDGHYHLKTVERYDPINCKWSFVAPMASERNSPGVAVLGGKLYAVGGLNNNNRYLRTVECYDPHTNEWTFSAPMIQGRAHLGVAVFNGCLYAIGGQNDSPVSISVSVERYDPGTDTWTAVAPLSSKYHEVSACLFDDRIVAVGRCIERNDWNRVEQYDPKRNEWSSMAPLISAVTYPHIVVVPKPLTSNSKTL